MYNLMIVDDDQLVRKRILSAIQFEKLGLQLCAEAEDGIQALDLFEQYHPQIVIMDINIPFLNGIDVSKKILEENENVNIVIVTGYGSVSFAKEAIRSGMVDFLLKPIDFTELEAALSRIVRSIREKTQQALERQRMERLLERGMPLLRSRYFQSLIRADAGQLQESDCRRYLTDFGITGTIRSICVAIVCPDYDGLGVDEQMSMQAVLEEEIQKGLSGSAYGSIVMFDSLQRLLIVAYGPEAGLDSILEEQLLLLRDRMRYLYRFDFHASIGSGVSEFRLLYKSFADAEKALNFWNVFGNNNIVSCENIRFADVDERRPDSLRYAQIMKLLVNADPQQLHEEISDYLNHLAYQLQNQIPVMQQKCIELTALLVTCAEELGACCAPAMRKQPYAQILYANNVFRLRKIVDETLCLLLEELGSKREQSSSRAISDAKQYILQNYADPELNLSKTAAHVHLTPSYVSQLFRKDEGCSFTDFLNRVRIEEAKKLLSQTHLRIYEVSEAVGYQNSKYFFQIFKQLTGKRPREFYEDAGGAQES